MNLWVSTAASLVAAVIGGMIALVGVNRTLREQMRLQDRAHVDAMTQELAGRLVAVEIALDSYAATRSEEDRGTLVAALNALLPQARVVELTVPAGALRERFEAVGTACSAYRRRLLRPRDPSEKAAETAARAAMEAATEAIQARYGSAGDGE